MVKNSWRYEHPFKLLPGVVLKIIITSSLHCVFVAVVAKISILGYFPKSPFFGILAFWAFLAILADPPISPISPISPILAIFPISPILVILAKTQFFAILAISQFWLFFTIG